MRAITVRQPWAWAIAHGQKDVENRTRNIAGDYRGPVAIHAGLGVDPAAKRTLTELIPGYDPAPKAHPERQHPWIRGAVVAVVDLTEVHDDDDCWRRDFRRLVDLYQTDPGAVRAIPDAGSGGLIGRARLCSPWAMHEHHHLVLANPRPLTTPVPAKGRLGLWTLPADVEARVLEQIGAPS